MEGIYKGCPLPKGREGQPKSDWRKGVSCKWEYVRKIMIFVLTSIIEVELVFKKSVLRGLVLVETSEN